MFSSGSFVRLRWLWMMLSWWYAFRIKFLMTPLSEAPPSPPSLIYPWQWHMMSTPLPSQGVMFPKFVPAEKPYYAPPCWVMCISIFLWIPNTLKCWFSFLFIFLMIPLFCVDVSISQLRLMWVRPLPCTCKFTEPMKFLWEVQLINHCVNPTYLLNVESLSVVLRHSSKLILGFPESLGIPQPMRNSHV